MSSLSTGSDQYKSQSGKTPPPAPSAAYAKRALEIQAEERMNNARYRPPALRTISTGNFGDGSSDGPPSVTSPSESSFSAPSYPPGFRRARAGTLPSNVQLAANNLFASAVQPPSSTVSPDYNSSFSEMTTNTNSNMGRPGLRHANSLASPSNSSTQNFSRLRSGSLTTLPSGLSSAFGPAVFASSWLANSNSTRPSGLSGLSSFDEGRSPNSAESNVGEEYGVATLDYLGLDDNPVRPPPPASMSELRNQAQAAIAGSLANPSRLRAQTVSNFNRRSLGSAQASMALESSTEEEESQDYRPYPSGGTMNRPRVDSLEGALGAPNQMLYNNAYVARGFKPLQHLSSGTAARPRAVSVSLLEDNLRMAAQRQGGLNQGGPMYANEPQQGQLHAGYMSTPVSGSSTPTPNSILRTTPSVHHTENREQSYMQSKGGMSRPTIQTVGVRFPDGTMDPSQRSTGLLSVPPNSASRSVSPKGELSGQAQAPSRSLWIGNLDSQITGQILANAFSKYGPIESFRMLAEKECGFVNFVDISDAIRAKDDVLEVHSGVIQGLGNSQPVRIGFGKIDSAPSTPMGVVSPGGFGTTPVSATAPAPAGLEAQLQSSPTRALWIGSIPSTTTPATILSIFSPYGPIESARVLTHKNCGFVNFERLDDAVRARKSLNGRDVLGPDVGAIRIGFARVPTKGSGTPTGLENIAEDAAYVSSSGVGDLSVGAAIHALRNIKGASTIPTDQQVLGGSVENYRSNLLLSLVSAGVHLPLGVIAGEETYANPGEGRPQPGQGAALVTEQQMVMRELSEGAVDSEVYIQALSEFRPPTMYYTTIPLVSDRAQHRRWDATKLRELRKRLDGGALTTEEVDGTVADVLDGEIVDLASDWLGNTVVQKLFEKCSPEPRLRMLERLAPHLATIGVHKNGTWAAQKIIECSNSPEEVTLISQNLRSYVPPLLLDQFGNYVVQCCLRFGAPANDFIFDAMIDRLWEIAQGRFGARSMRACLESSIITVHQQRRLATAIVLNSIPLATNPNGALLLTWLLDSSGFPARYRLLAPRFTPHLSHLCSHKLASLTVLRIINQKLEPDAAAQILRSLFYSANDQVLNDVLSDQVNGVATILKILTSAFIDPTEHAIYVEATKRVLIELKASGTQAYRRLVEEVGLPVTVGAGPVYLPSPHGGKSPQQSPPTQGRSNSFGMQGVPMGYGNTDPSFASAFQAMQLQGGGGSPGGFLPGGMQSMPRLQMDGNFGPAGAVGIQAQTNSPRTFSPTTDPFNPFALRSPDLSPVSPPRNARRNNAANANATPLGIYPQQPALPSLAQAGTGLMGMNQQQPYLQQQNIHPQQMAYMLQHMQMMQNGAYPA